MREEETKETDITIQTTETKETPANQHAAIATACCTFTVISVAMILLNKAIIMSIPFGGGLVLLQNAATILIVQASRQCRFPKGFGWKPMVDNALCAFLFGANTFTSIQSLFYLSVTTFTILRNMQPIISCPIDYFMRGESLKPVSIYLLCTILLGTIAYCGKDMRANIEGIAWTAVHLLTSTLYAVLTKMRLEKADDNNCNDDKNNKLGQALDLAWYNNALSLPLIGIAAAMQAMHTPPRIDHCGLHCWIMVILSCFTGCAMSVAGLKTQELISPVTFLTFNNLNKIPAMFISAAIWPQLEITDTTQEIMGIVLSIYGGYLYALSKQGDVNPIALFISLAMSIALVPLIVLGEMADQRPFATNTTKAP
jgi:drug/metabolite transporter (DMT)-like permease